MKIVLLAAMVTCSLALPIGAATLNTNLITNGGAETGDTTGWTNPGGLNVVTDNGDSYAEVTSGTYGFTAATGPADAQMWQSIDISGLSGLIDTGLAQYALVAQMQDRVLDSSRDLAQLRVSFSNGLGSILGTSAILYDRQRASGQFDFSEVATTGAVPVGSREALVSLRMTRNSGGSTDAFVDDMSLAMSSNAPPLSPVPLPAGLPLVISGVGALVVLRRRR